MQVSVKVLISRKQTMQTMTTMNKCLDDNRAADKTLSNVHAVVNQSADQPLERLESPVRTGYKNELY